MCWYHCQKVCCSVELVALKSDEVLFTTIVGCVRVIGEKNVDKTSIFVDHIL